MNKIRKVIKINGLVQGVGFRPFVYKIAIKNNILGRVNNGCNGLTIDIEGVEDCVDSFLETLINSPPPLSIIKDVIIEERTVFNYNSFEIVDSDISEKVTTIISTDLSICEDCKKEILDKNNRRFMYPFTNCTNCGPRFSIIKELPYDRDRTTMANFAMCERCKEEYENPLDRRFHAQPNGCPSCGPKVTLKDKCGETVICDDVIIKTCELLKEGALIAIKGIGGFNIACDFKNNNVINKLRYKKHRPAKPLAIMLKDIITVKKYCNVNEKEIQILEGSKKPIVLLRKKDIDILPESLAPNNKKLGVMLPYTPLHYLLLNDQLEGLVMTSANISGEPMIYKNNEAISSLKSIVDYFLINNREINMPIDDSVVMVVDNEEYLIRPGRGYMPMTLGVKSNNEILALGSEMKNTITLSSNENIFISQHIGDLKNLNVFNGLKKAIEYFSKVYNINPTILVRDNHPQFIYRDLKFEKNIKILNTQHHHSHIASCLFENQINNKVIGIAFDGTGYGDDKQIWGGEFLLCNKKNYKRVAHLEYFKLPGGDSAVREPWKIATSLLYKIYGNDFGKKIPSCMKNENYKVICKMIEKDINIINTSSMGRFFDGVSALIGLSEKTTFDGEAAIALENLYKEDIKSIYQYEIEDDKEVILKIDTIINGIVTDIEKNISRNIIAAKFHNTIIDSTIKLSEKLRLKYSINLVALSGGVFQNEVLLKGIKVGLQKSGFIVYVNRKIPCNDSGISAGQVAIAEAIYK